MSSDSGKYPYIATLKHPTLIHEALALNILSPIQVVDQNRNTSLRQSYVLQTTDDLQLYEIRSHGEHHLISTQPLYTEVKALKRLKCQKDGWKQDFLFMLTKELKLHILHFNKSKAQLEIISTYKIDA